MHPTIISEGFQTALNKSLEILQTIMKPVDLNDRESLIKCVVTALSSKVVCGNSDLLAPIAVDAVLKVLFLFQFDSIMLFVRLLILK